MQLFLHFFSLCGTGTSKDSLDAVSYTHLDVYKRQVLSRWLGIDTPIDSTEGKKLFVRIADELLDCECPGLYNQAIMDLSLIHILS